MNQNRRNFWKFLAASPAALVAPLIAARERPTLDAAAITIEGDNVTLSNCVIQDAPIFIKKGAKAGVFGCMIEHNSKRT